MKRRDFKRDQWEQSGFYSDSVKSSLRVRLGSPRGCRVSAERQQNAPENHTFPAQPGIQAAQLFIAAPVTQGYEACAAWAAASRFSASLGLENNIKIPERKIPPDLCEQDSGTSQSSKHNP